MKKIALDEFCNISFLSQIKYSKDGKKACFVVSKANKDNNNYSSNIYKFERNKITQLTSGNKERSFIFLDNDHLLFQSNREENKEPNLKSYFYEISLKGGEAKLKYSFDLGVNQLIPLKNKDLILIASTIPQYEDIYKNPKLIQDYLKNQKDNEDYEVVEDVPFWFNGSTFTRGGYSSIYYYHHKNKKIERLSELNFEVDKVLVNEDETGLYFLGNKKEKLMNIKTNVLSYFDFKTKETKKVFESSYDNYLDDFYLAKSFILALITKHQMGGNTDPDFYKISYQDNKVEKYLEFGEAIGSSVGSDVRYGAGQYAKIVGDTFYFVSTQFNSSYLFKLEDGRVEKLTNKEGSVDCFDVYDDQILMVGMYDTKPQELYNQDLKQLSQFNILKNKFISIPEEIKIRSNNKDVYGYILKPYNFRNDQKYPVILDIHGGPKTVYGNVFYHEMQYWASLGYFVVYCNPKGSDGRKEFMDIFGKYGVEDYSDLMNFLDACLKKYPEIDVNHQYETGGSYGGFMTNWIIGHTNRFKACVSQRSISNWFSFYGVSDIGTFFTEDQCLATPWDKPEKLWEQSPMKYADKVKTPTLFIHSFDDYRCPIDQGYQMFTSLVAFKVDAKMVLFKGENHELSRSGKPQHRLRRLDEITKWFESHQ